MLSRTCCEIIVFMWKERIAECNLAPRSSEQFRQNSVHIFACAKAEQMGERGVDVDCTRQLLCAPSLGDAGAAHHPRCARQLRIHDVMRWAEDRHAVIRVEAHEIVFGRIVLLEIGKECTKRAVCIVYCLPERCLIECARA